MLLFSSSAPINQFLFGGDTSKRLEDIEKTNKVVRKAKVQQNSFSKHRHFNSGGYSQCPFLGKNLRQPISEATKSGGKNKEPKT